MKKLFKILCILLTLCFILLLPFTYGCIFENQHSSEITFDKIPEFITEYSEEEHLERVKNAIIEKDKNYFFSVTNKIVSTDVQIVYSYLTEDPEYILITIEHERPYEVRLDNTTMCQTRYEHALLRIKDDDYKYVHSGSGAIAAGFICGVSPYQAYGHLNDKKYYGWGEYSVELDGQKVNFFEKREIDNEAKKWFCGEAYVVKEMVLSEVNERVLLYKSRTDIRDMPSGLFWDFDKNS